MAWMPDYIVLNDLKNYLKIDLTDTTDDVELQLAITASSRAVDKFCSERRNGLGAFRQFGKTTAPQARYYTPIWRADLLRWAIEIDDLMDITGLTVQIDTSNTGTYNQSITDYVLRPLNAVSNNRPYTQIVVSPNSSVQPVWFKDSAKVTANVWGWNSFPSEVVLATKLQASRFNKRRVAPFGVSGSPQKGTEQGVEFELDPDIAQMLSTVDLVKLGWTV